MSWKQNKQTQLELGPFMADLSKEKKTFTLQTWALYIVLVKKKNLLRGV